MDENKKIYLAWVSILALGVIWGGSFFLMKQGLRSFSYWQVSSIRLFSAFLFLLPFSIKYFKKLKRKNIINILIVAFIGNLIPSILFPLGQTRVDSNIAGVLNSMVPVFVLIFGVSFFKNKTNILQIIGVTLGLVGAAMLVTKDNLFVFGQMNFYALYIVIATIFYAVNINQVNKFLKSLKGIEIAALAFLFIGPVSGTILFLSDFSQAALSDTMVFDLLCIITLGLFGSAIAVAMVNFVITNAGAMFASSVTYIIPVFAIAWGVVDGETINIVQIFATIVVLLGVYLVNKRKT